jgi:hypothetical protein
MSWIKPNFLWMMYRSAWATKEGQEVILAIRLCREGFDEILSRAVQSTFSASGGNDRDAWQRQVKESDVRLQWDPDHDPNGADQPRRAIQLGLRGEAMRSYCDDWTISVEDGTGFVHAQSKILNEAGVDALVTPREEVYPVSDPSLRDRLGMEPLPAPSQHRGGA